MRAFCEFWNKFCFTQVSSSLNAISHRVALPYFVSPAGLQGPGTAVRRSWQGAGPTSVRPLVRWPLPVLTRGGSGPGARMVWLWRCCGWCLLGWLCWPGRPSRPPRRATTRRWSGWPLRGVRAGSDRQLGGHGLRGCSALWMGALAPMHPPLEAGHPIRLCAPTWMTMRPGPYEGQYQRHTLPPRTWSLAPFAGCLLPPATMGRTLGAGPWHVVWLRLAAPLQ